MFALLEGVREIRLIHEVLSPGNALISIELDEPWPGSVDRRIREDVLVQFVVVAEKCVIANLQSE